MEKAEILENLLIIIQEELENIMAEDEALKMSDERRRKFKAVVFSNPTLNEGPVNGSSAPNSEAQNAGAGPSPNTPTGQSGTDGSGNMGVDNLGDSPMPNGTDLGGTPSMDGSTPTGGAPENMPDDLGGEEGMDLGGGGGGDLGGGFGGGGGGGGLSDLGGDENGGTDGSEENAPPPETFDPFKDSNSLEDRLQVILSTAESIAEQTQDPQKVLKAVKGLIQNGFKNPDQAARAISDLFDTDNPVLQQVSRRLALYTWGI